MGRPEEDFADEVGGEEPPPDAGVPQHGDGDVGMAGEAPDDEDPYQMPSSDSDVSGLAEDAGEGASYGFDAARDTVRFDRPADAEEDLADSVARRADESSKYAVGPEVLDAEPAAFAEVAGSVDPDEELGLAPSEGGYADAAEDDPNLASSVDDQGGYAADEQAGYAGDDQAGYAADEQAGYAADDQAGYTADEQAGYAADDQAGYAPDDQGGYTADDQGGYTADDQAGYAPDDQAGYAPDDQGGYMADDQAGYTPDDQGGYTADDQTVSEQAQAYLDEEPPAPPRSAAPAPAPTGEEDVKPGQIRRSALDEMFARAAELKRKKPS